MQDRYPMLFVADRFYFTFLFIFFLFYALYRCYASAEQLYGFADKNTVALPVPVVYYRLKMWDRDNLFAYSGIVQLGIGSRKPVTIHPNPSTDFIQLQLAGTNGRLTVRDAGGRVVKQVQAEGNAALKIDVSTWAKGLCFVTVDGETTRFLKQ